MPAVNPIWSMRILCRNWVRNSFFDYRIIGRPLVDRGVSMLLAPPIWPEQPSGHHSLQLSMAASLTPCMRLSGRSGRRPLLVTQFLGERLVRASRGVCIPQYGTRSYIQIRNAPSAQWPHSQHLPIARRLLHSLRCTDRTTTIRICVS